MKQVIMLGILILAAGCTVSPNYVRPQAPSPEWGCDTGTRGAFMYQVGVRLRLVNDWADYVDVERPDQGLLAACMWKGDSQTIGLPSAPLSGRNMRYREIPILVRGYNSSGEIVGYQTCTLEVDVEDGSRDEIWILRSGEEQCPREVRRH